MDCDLENLENSLIEIEEQLQVIEVSFLDTIKTCNSNAGSQNADDDRNQLIQKLNYQPLIY